MISEPRRSGWLGRSFLLLALIPTIGFLTLLQASAKDSAPGGVAPQNQTRPKSDRTALDERVRQFARNMDLTEEQQSAVKRILEQQQQTILKIRLDSAMAGRAGIDRLRALQVITVQRIRAVLNEEQKKKYDPLAPRMLPQTQQLSLEDWLKAMTVKK